MKIYPLIIFLMVLSPAYAQVEDHFDDGNFNSFPSWQGNGPDFNVNAALQLQLNAVTAGNSYLSVPANLNSLDSIEWHFYIRLAFSPSSSNNARVYLSSDQSDLTRPLNGYFLQFGEALSSDAIELFRQDSSTKTSICRAADGMISTPFSVRVKVTRNGTGIWTLSVDYNGAENYNTEATGVDVIYNNASFIGVNCQYTSGNTGNFYFDDFYAGPIIGDTLPPSVTSVTAESENTLALIFSEKMENSTAVSPGSYDVNNGIGHPVTITPDTTDPLKYLLSFSDHFHPGEVNTILFSGLKDVNQNQMPDSTINFTYSPLASAQFNDVVFSEIYFENSSLSPLPDAEYVEIYNRRDSSILLEGWTISDGNTEGTIPGFRLEPHGYALLFSEDDSAGFAGFANGIGVHSFPSLNNDVGDRLVIKNANSEIITELFFNDGYYHDNQKNDGGWSVERIDVGFTCENEENWTASVSNLHGTPGAGNSVNARFIDDVRPLVSNIFLKDSNRVTIYFSENISDGLSDVNNFAVKNTSDIYTYPSSVTIISGKNIELNFASAFSGGIFFLELNPAISDCPGNKILVDDELKFGYPETAASNDILINELLFYPFDDGNDFVELYNGSGKIIDLKDWIVAEADYMDSTEIKDQALITQEHRLVFPGEFLVLSENDEKVKSFYRVNNTHVFLDVENMPDFNSDEGRCVIYDHTGKVIDAFRYSEELHFPLLEETKGISLERLSLSGKSDDTHNWHSAAATAGFATPGYGNSQRLDSVDFTGEISIEEKVFSPDNDGYNDVLTIHYHFPQPGTMLSLNVFDSNGQPIRTIVDGETVSNEGAISWDGLKDNRVVASSGFYIILAKSFNLNGGSKAYKELCYLTKK